MLLQVCLVMSCCETPRFQSVMHCRCLRFIFAWLPKLGLRPATKAYGMVIKVSKYVAISPKVEFLMAIKSAANLIELLLIHLLIMHEIKSWSLV